MGVDLVDVADGSKKKPNAIPIVRMVPQGSKASYSSKQKRQASHIEESVKRRGRSRKTAERIAWATVNKQDGGARGRKSAKKSSSRGGRSKRSRGRTSKRSH